MDIFRHFNHKRWLIIGTVILAGALLAGCMGPQFTYQGVLMDASGNPYNGSVTITYRIFAAETGGTEIYDQTETVTVTEGRFDSIVGPGSAIAGLDPADLSQPLWIELEIDDGTYAETLEPRQRLYGAPYAFTLMPGAVISAAMAEEVHGLYNVNAVTSVQNEQVSDASFTALPALRVVGEKGIELVGTTTSDGTLYSDMNDNSSSIEAYVMDDFIINLDTDHNEYGAFLVYGDTVSDWCRFNDSGDFNCTGSKSSVTEIDGETRALYAIESPDVWFEDFGSAQLSMGSATVQVDALFAQSVNLKMDYHVFLTPLGDCNGLYVTDKTATGFEVRELGGGASNVSFDYRIVAKRAGYESQRMEIVPTGSEGLGQ